MCRLYVGWDDPCYKCDKVGFSILESWTLKETVEKRPVLLDGDRLDPCDCREELYVACTSQFEQPDMAPYKGACRDCHKIWRRETHARMKELEDDDAKMPDDWPFAKIFVTPSSFAKLNGIYNAPRPLKVRVAEDELVEDLLWGQVLRHRESSSGSSRHFGQGGNNMVCVIKARLNRDCGELQKELRRIQDEGDFETLNSHLRYLRGRLDALSRFEPDEVSGIDRSWMRELYEKYAREQAESGAAESDVGTSVSSVTESTATQGVSESVISASDTSSFAVDRRRRGHR